MASITSNYEKLPLFIIVKAKSPEEAEDKICEMIDRNQFTFSVKSYMNTECFIQYLQFLRDQYPESQKINLIIDQYSSHLSKLAQETAQNLNIELFYIPGHYTDILQPLDIAIFAPLKSKANSKIRRLLLDDSIKQIGMKTALAILQEAWRDLPESTLANAWELYI